MTAKIIKLFVRAVISIKQFLFGKGSYLPRALGWLMFDYPFEKYYTTECGYVNVVDIVIGANTFSKGYGKRFRITDDREL